MDADTKFRSLTEEALDDIREVENNLGEIFCDEAVSDVEYVKVLIYLSIAKSLIDIAISLNLK
jgi:hypothetical protein